MEVSDRDGSPWPLPSRCRPISVVFAGLFCGLASGPRKARCERDLTARRAGTADARSVSCSWSSGFGHPPLGIGLSGLLCADLFRRWSGGLIVLTAARWRPAGRARPYYERTVAADREAYSPGRARPAGNGPASGPSTSAWPGRSADGELAVLLDGRHPATGKVLRRVGDSNRAEPPRVSCRAWFSGTPESLRTPPA